MLEPFFDEVNRKVKLLINSAFTRIHQEFLLTEKMLCGSFFAIGQDLAYSREQSTDVQQSHTKR